MSANNENFSNFEDGLFEGEFSAATSVRDGVADISIRITKGSPEIFFCLTFLG